MRGAQGLVHIEVHHVKAHVAHAHLAHDGVHVGAVVIEQRVHLAQFFHDARQVQLHETQRVGAGHHQTGHVLAVLGNGRGQGVRVHHAVAGLDVHGLKTGQRGGSRIGAVGRVRNEHFFAIAALGLMVGRDELDAREFAVGSGHGLEGEGLHARELAQPALGLIEALQRALRAGRPARELGQQRMQAAEAGQRGHVFGELGIVLHGAGAKGVEIGVHTVIEFGKPGEVPHHVQLRTFGQARRIFAQQTGGQHLRRFGRVGIYLPGATAGHGFGENGFHSRPPTVSARKPIWRRLLSSVQASSSTFSMPG